MRRVLAGVFLVLILATGGWLGAQVLREPALSPGQAMPALAYRTDGGAVTLRPQGSRPTAVLLFHSRCSHCHYQLDALSREWRGQDGARLIVLTTEDSLPRQEMQGRWKALTAAPGVEWGTVRAQDFQREFGVLSTPVTFAFGADGRLRQKVAGEAKPSFLSRALRS